MPRWVAGISTAEVYRAGVMISGVLLDLAGVIYEGESALPGALEAVDRLRHAGLSLRLSDQHHPHDEAYGFATPC